MGAEWGHITAEQIRDAVGGTLGAGDPGARFSGVSTDSRTVGEGQLFVALKGARFDGHRFMDGAVERGAAGVVIEPGHALSDRAGRGTVVITVHDTLRALGDLAAWWRLRHTATVVAVTGSAGKTTTKELTAAALSKGGGTLKTPGNFNNLIGVPLTVLRMDATHRNAVVEMGMNMRGEIARLTEIVDPLVGIITNVGMVHMEGLGSLRAVAEAKWELVETMDPGATVIINGDDRLLAEMARTRAGRVTTFGMGAGNHVRAEAVTARGIEGVSFDLCSGGVRRRVRLHLPGVQNAYNALAAAAAAFAVREPAEHIVEGLERFRGLKGRFMITTLPCGSTLVDDTYNSNPSALRAALDTLGAGVGPGSRILVGLGEMLELGAVSSSAHREAGRMVAGIGAHLFLAMGPHAGDMIAGARESGMPASRAFTVEDHEEMAAGFKGVTAPGDVVFLKGSRGMALERVAERLLG